MSYTGHENTQIFKITENFVAFEFTISRRRLKSSFTVRKTKIMGRKTGKQVRMVTCSTTLAPGEFKASRRFLS